MLVPRYFCLAPISLWNSAKPQLATGALTKVYVLLSMLRQLLRFSFGCRCLSF